MDKFIIISLLFGIMISGCFNITQHSYDQPEIYGGTCYCCHMIAIPFIENEGPEAVYSEAYATLFLPLSIIDFPFEFVGDTITLPYDLINHKTENEGKYK